MPSWSHDGQWIYFSSDRSGSWQIWKQPVAGGDAIQVTRNGGFIAFETADGTALYFTKPEQTGFWRIPVTGGDETVVLDVPASHNWQDWVLTRRGIFFVQLEPRTRM
jgi:Tol biopolymer transport system component